MKETSHLGLKIISEYRIQKNKKICFQPFMFSRIALQLHLNNCSRLLTLTGSQMAKLVKFLNIKVVDIQILFPI